MTGPPLQLSGLQRLMPGESDPPPASITADAQNSSNQQGMPVDSPGALRLYDESSDSFVMIRYEKILEQCRRFINRANNFSRRRLPDDPLSNVIIPDQIGSVLLLRPNIEHYMLGMIMGKGGSTDDLGATLWGQTELSCFDDGQHGVWGM